MSKIEDAVAKKIQERAELGKNKYGVTMERDDLSNLQWLVHAQEEAMDLAVYLERIIQEFTTKESHQWLIDQYNRNRLLNEMVHTWEQFIEAKKQEKNG